MAQYFIDENQNFYDLFKIMNDFSKIELSRDCLGDPFDVGKNFHHSIIKPYLLNKIIIRMK